jgi:HD-GYP domain-containing protein (c-di-GMP phosphodiesterase class II)
VDQIQPATEQVRLSEVLAALSQALDLTEGQPMGHTARACAIGMRIADEAGIVGADERSSLFYALLLKDAGCSSNSARVCAMFGHDDIAIKTDLKTVNYHNLKEALGYITRNIQPDGSAFKRAMYLKDIVRSGTDGSRALTRTRCERGANIARMLGFNEDTAMAIHSLDEHWNGKGYPDGLIGDRIPLYARIINLAQSAEIFFRLSGVDAALDVCEERSGTWFDPELVTALLKTRIDSGFWRNLEIASVGSLVRPLEPEDHPLIADEDRLDQVAEAFAQVIDAKSPFTASHSVGVATIAVGVSRLTGASDVELRDMWRAGLLHDIGKLGISNSILDKPDKLDAREWRLMKEHPKYSMEILSRISAFRGIAPIAGAHHERIDGSGYHQGLSGSQLSKPARILAVADVCEALMADRPYRDSMPMEQVLEIIDGEAGSGLDIESVEALKIFLETYVAGGAAAPVAPTGRPMARLAA